MKTRNGKFLRLVGFFSSVVRIIFYRKQVKYLKRLGNLYEQVCTPENVALALTKAARGKKRRRGIVNTLNRKDKAITAIVKMLSTDSYRTSPYHEKIVLEPKKRTIYSLPFYPDRIVHHAIMNVLEPIWDKLLDSACHSCRKGRGCHSGSRKCMEYVRKYRYALKCDVSKFYPSIDHAICKGIIRKKLKDPRLLALLDEIIDSANTIPNATIGKNAPIGNLLSQWLGNLYLNELDLYLRQECGVHAYIRYCDDFIVFSDDKAFLSDLRAKLLVFLESRLKLKLSKAVLSPVSRGIDFLGYRHFPRYVLVRKRVARKIKEFVKAAQAGKLTNITHARGTAASYLGILSHANTHNFKMALNFDAILEQYGVAQ